LKEVLKGFTENQAFTDISDDDSALRGRTYAIPFEAVWQAAMALGGGGLRGWSLERVDDQAGVIKARVTAGILKPSVMIRIDIGLDANAQTRVDLAATARTERGDLGRSRRLIRRFVRRLDRKLKARPDQIWDTADLPSFEEAS
jgi:hypothetical protein